MTKRLGIAAVLLAVVWGGCGGEPPKRLYEKDGGFSYDPPANWEIGEFPGLKYRIARGPTTMGFTANINVIDEKFSGTLVEYVDINLTNMKQVIPSLELLKREDFRTADGRPAIRTITETVQHTRRLRQTAYFFGKGKRKYVVTCSALADGGEALDEVFESSMKTFRLH
ncbi:MAG: hypothetical protein ACYS47_15280 [Planctomycetota bacterium]